MGICASLGVAPRARGGARLSPVEELLERYRRYLLVERALTVGTAKVYVGAIRPFVASFEVAGRLELERITAADVSAFVLAEASRAAGTSIRSVATALRSLLVFLHVEGLIERSLTGAVPGVGAWRGAALPQPLERGRAAPAAGQLRPAHRGRPARFRDRRADGPAGSALRRGRRAHAR